MALSTGNGADFLPCTADDTLAAFTTTGLDGTYLFTGLAPGTYVVCADVGPNHVAGDGDGVLGAYTATNGPQSAGHLYSSPAIVAADEIRTDVDFGFNNPALKSIADRVWFDVNTNGVQDPGEPGIAGVTVNLFAAGLVKGSAVTDADGNFIFSGLPNGNFTITIEDVDGKLIGFGTTAAAQSGTFAVALAGADVSGVHFGYNAPGSIGDTLWSDDDADGFQDPGESGILGVAVRLYSDTNGNGLLDIGTDALVATTATDATGRYLFTVGTAGRYFVSVPTQSGAGAPLEGFALTTVDEDPAAGDQLRIDLFSLLTSELTADFGYNNPSYFDILGTVFEDGDGNGLWAPPGEPGISGVTLALYDVSDVLLATTTADADGNYSFPGLRDGTYTVRVTDTAGVLDDWEQTAPALPAPPARTVVLAGADAGGNDFGFRKKPTIITLSAFGAVASPAGVVVTWSTRAEHGVAGYLVLRVEGERESPVSDRIVPALLESAAGGSYALLDREAHGTPVTYRLVEVRRSGPPVHHGPFVVTPRTQAGQTALAAMATAASTAPYARRARRETGDRAASPVAPAAAQPLAAGERVRLVVLEDGLYRVRAAEIAPLLGLGLDRVRLLIAGGRLVLSSGGRRVAYLPLADGDGLLFHGRRLDTNYTGENVYWIGRGAGLRMRTADGTPATPPEPGASFADSVRAEEQRWPDTATAADPGADYWLWDYLVGGDQLSENRLHAYPVAAPGAVPGGAAQLTVRLRGGSDDGTVETDHHVRVRVDGQEACEANWAGLEPLDLACDLPAGLVSAAGNTVEVEALLDTGAAYSLVLVDAFDLRYDRAFNAVGDRLLLRADGAATVRVGGFSGPSVQVFDLTDPRRPRLLTGAKVRPAGGAYAVFFRPAAPTTPYLAVGPGAVRPWRGSPRGARRGSPLRGTPRTT